MNGIYSTSFSVIIPTYNECHYLVELLDNLLKQTFKQFKIIISDDSTTDDIENYIKNYKGELDIRYERNKSTLGRVANYRNALYTYVDTKWVLLCDGDDFIFDENYFKDALSLLSENEDVVFLQAGDIKGEHLNGRVRLPNINSSYEIFSGEEYLLKFTNIGHFSHLTTIFNVELAKKIDFYRYDNLSSDIESFLRLASYGKIILLKKAVGLWRQHKENASRLAQYDQRIENLDWIDSVYLHWKRTKKINNNVLFEWRKELKNIKIISEFNKQVNVNNNPYIFLKLWSSTLLLLDNKYKISLLRKKYFLKFLIKIKCAVFGA